MSGPAAAAGTRAGTAGTRGGVAVRGTGGGRGGGGAAVGRFTERPGKAGAELRNGVSQVFDPCGGLADGVRLLEGEKVVSFEDEGSR